MLFLAILAIFLLSLVAFGQGRVRERWWGYMHTVLFYAFLVFLLSSAEILVWWCSGMGASHWIGCDFAGVLHLVQTGFAWLTIVAVIVLTVRRIVRRHAVHNTPEAFAILGLIAGIMVSHIGFTAAGLAFGAEKDGIEAAWLADALPITARFARAIDAGDAQWWRTIWAAVHLLCMAAFLVWIPRGKHLHIFFAFPAIALQYREYDENGVPIIAPDSPDMDKYAEDLEAAIDRELPEEQWPTPGVRNIADFTPSRRLQAYACTQCQRCTNACPLVAAAVDGCAGPMQSVLSLRKSLDGGHLGNAAIPVLCGESEVWACTQCGACDRACSVGVAHVERNIQLRRHLVATENVPSRLNALFAAFERSGNPWGSPRADRNRWSEGLTGLTHPNEKGSKEAETSTVQWTVGVESPVSKGNAQVEAPIGAKTQGISYCELRERPLAGSGAEPREKREKILIFAGCMAAYDAGARETLRNAVGWLLREGFSVEVLPSETCCGEPLRRLGNEAAFQAHRDENLAAIGAIPHDVILTACPHCAQTLAEDYVVDGRRLRVMHFLAFFAERFARGEIEIDGAAAREAAPDAVIHFPCRIAKHPTVPAGLFALCDALGLRRLDERPEMAHCCGAGGGRFFVDETREVARMRARELVAAAPKAVATACPFCMRTIGDELVRACENSGISMINMIDVCVRCTHWARRMTSPPSPVR